MAKRFADDFKRFNLTYQATNEIISGRCKDIERCSKALAQEYFGLSHEMEHLQVLILKKTEIPQFATLYQRMSDLLKGTANLIIH